MRRLERLPVRVRLAVISAGLTFAILAGFASIVGVLTARQLYSSFDDNLKLTATELASQFHVRPTPISLRLDFTGSDDMVRAATAGDAAVRLVTSTGAQVSTGNGPSFGAPSVGMRNFGGYRVTWRQLHDGFGRPVDVYLQYAKPLESVHHTLSHVRLFLLLGVLVGTALALLGGLALARRAMAPVVRLTGAAKDIARTRDPAVTLPQPAAEDEVADLARTLEQMLGALGAARAETQAALERQREFVADASHELRTPLTSILANLELLEAELNGEQADMAGSALRSSRRMRRLVGDLLLLARADAGRETPHERVDLAQVVREAAAEAAPIGRDHELGVELAAPVAVDGSADELHRLALNLIQNALTHTPPGTEVQVAVRREGDEAILAVADDGPGIPAEMRARIFDRFVRADGDRAGGGSGLGLAIVRAVAESHGGTVELSESRTGGARFVVRLPVSAARPALLDPVPVRGAGS